MRASLSFIAVGLIALSISSARADEAPAAAPAAPAAKVSRDQLDELLSNAVQNFKQGQVDEAIHGLQRCVNLNKNYAACSRTLGIVYGKAGDNHRAAYYLKAYLKLAPHAPDAERISNLVKEYEG